MTTTRFQWQGWETETDLGNDDDRAGVHYLTIADEDGEEVAVIMHRTVGGKYPLDGPVALAKQATAQRIVDALNAADDTADVDYADTSADHEHVWMVTEDGYSRSWSTEIDDESKVITATYDGSSDFSEGGSGEYLVCTQCAVRADIPEGYEIEWN